MKFMDSWNGLTRVKTIYINNDAPAVLLDDVFVSSIGNDYNVGSSVSPVRTINKAISLVKPKGKIHFVGEFRDGNIQINNSQKEFTLDGTLAKFKGLSKLTKERYFDGYNEVWKIRNPLKNYCIQRIVVNGEKRENTCLNRIRMRDFVVHANGDMEFVVPDSENRYYMQITNKDNAYVVIHTLFCFIHRRITSYDSATGKVYIAGSVLPEYHDFENIISSIFIYNLNMPLDFGEFYNDQDYIYYKPYPWETFDLDVETIVFDNFINITDSSNISFENFDCSFFGKPFYKEIITGQAAHQCTSAINLINCKDITFQNCNFNNISNYCVWVKNGSEDVSVVDSYFNDLGSGGVRIGAMTEGVSQVEGIAPTRINVENNKFEKGGRIWVDGVPIFLQHGNYCKINNNEISDFYYSGISCGFVWGTAESPTHHNEISYNIIHNLGQYVLNDLAGIYTLGVQTGTHIHHNIIYDIRHDFFLSFGIYNDNGSSNILIENNLIYDCGEAGIFTSGYNNVFKNNILAYNYTAISVGLGSAGNVMSTLENNIVVGNGDPHITAIDRYNFMSRVIDGNIILLNNTFWFDGVYPLDIPITNNPQLKKEGVIYYPTNSVGNFIPIDFTNAGII